MHLHLDASRALRIKCVMHASCVAWLQAGSLCLCDPIRDALGLEELPGGVAELDEDASRTMHDAGG